MKNNLGPDMCVPCGEGIVNLRVGAIIQKDGKILMVKTFRDYCYSVGGRIKFGETAEQAIVREVFEETGTVMTVDRLGFVHENYFYGDGESNLGKTIYEISFYFFMNAPDDFQPVCGSFTAEGVREELVWLDPHGDVKYYPEFFRTALDEPADGVRFFFSDDRT